MNKGKNSRIVDEDRKHERFTVLASYGGPRNYNSHRASFGQTKLWRLWPQLSSSAELMWPPQPSQAQDDHVGSWGSLAKARVATSFELPLPGGATELATNGDQGAMRASIGFSNRFGLQLQIAMGVAWSTPLK
ncbi:hypothetical protein NL676_035634 [Syzygium grande]|nr:hypothetical protein NL676_035634 [Syzygium grande]